MNAAGEMRLLMDKITLHKSGQVLGIYGFTDEEGSFYAEVIENNMEN